MLYIIYQRCKILVTEELAASKEMEHYEAGAPDVHLLVVVAVRKYLRSSLLGTACLCHQLCAVAVVSSRHVEVYNFDHVRVSFRKKHILGFEVSVHDAVVVQVAEG